MTSWHSFPIVEARLDALEAQLLALGDRVRTMEQRGPISSPAPAPTPSPWVPAPAHAPPTQLGFDELVAGDETHGETASPVRVLATTGGVALLLGLIGFVAYAIEQDWLSPLLRFVGAALLAALLTVAAWPLARRGHHAVAGAVGGAGLGAHFGAWLFARHAHELVTGPQLTIALALGAAACLLVADRLRLRLMAVLASLAACATPMLVAVGSGKLGELMVYQLAVVAVLLVVDVRRRWPELPTIALASAWLLGGHWAAVHLEPGDAGGFMVWSLVLLGASVVSAWRLLRAELDAAEQSHALARLLIGGLTSWAAAAFAFGHAPSTLALASLGLAAWHGVVAWMLARRRDGQGTPFAMLGWMQALVAGPLLLGGAALSWWWIGMSVVAAVGSRLLRTTVRPAWMLVPAVAAVSWCVAHESSAWSLMLGLLAAAVPLVMGLIGARERVLAAMPIIAGTLLWTIVVLALGPDPIVARLAWCLVPLCAVVVRVGAQPSREALSFAIPALGLTVVELVVAIVDSDVLTSHGHGSTALGLSLIAAALAGLCVALAVRAAAARRVELLDGDDELGPIGVLVAALGGIAATLVLAAMVSNAALLQVGITGVAALVGLAAVVAGLRGQQASWRQLGLGLIACAGIKVVCFDLAAAAVVWRALSFMGLGAVLIAGALAYSRAQQRTAELG